MRVIDLFCGCGGLSYGFVKQGYEIVCAFDNWDKAVNTYNKNFKHKAEKADIGELKADYLRGLLPDILIGGPPCQDYSAAGNHIETDERAGLTIRFATIVSEVKPKWFVMENVERIVKSNALEIAIDIYKKAGYGLTKVVLDASLCGVPQKRKRFFMIGELDGKDDFLTKELENGQSKSSMTVYDYLGDEFGIIYYYRHPRSYARRGVFSIFEPSPTVRGVNRPVPPNYPGHSGDATKDLCSVRSLTTMERARIQTFPKSFCFEGNKTDLEQMIGNAVPVELASYVAGKLKKYISGRKNFCSVSTDEQINIEHQTQTVLF